jgi:hypothetical protein
MLQAGRLQVQFLMSSLDFSIDLILPTTLWSWGQLSLWQKWVPGIFLGVKVWLVRKADNLTAIYEPIVKKIWEPWYLTTIWASTACYRDSFTFTRSYDFWGAAYIWANASIFLLALLLSYLEIRISVTKVQTFELHCQVGIFLPKLTSIITI